jgi:hypothetical protein
VVCACDRLVEKSASAAATLVTANVARDGGGRGGASGATPPRPTTVSMIVSSSVGGGGSGGSGSDEQTNVDNMEAWMENLSPSKEQATLDRHENILSDEVCMFVCVTFCFVPRELSS